MKTPPKNPRCTRDQKRRLVVRAERAWLRWLGMYAHHLNVPVSLLVEKAVEEFAAARDYQPRPPRRYVRMPRFDEVSGVWTDAEGDDHDAVVL